MGLTSIIKQEFRGGRAHYQFCLEKKDEWERALRQTQILEGGIPNEKPQTGS